MVSPEGVFDITESLSVIKRRKWEFTAIFIVVLSVGIAIAWLLPSIYKSESKVLIERQQIPDSLVSSTVTGFVQERIQLIAQRILTAEILLPMAQKVGLPEADLDPASEDFEDKRNDLVEDIITNTSVEMVDVQVETPRSGRSTSLITVAFTVSFKYRDATLAMRMTDALTDRILQENVNQRREQALLAADFLRQEGRRIRREIASIEAELSEMVADRYDILPDQLSDTRELLTSQRTELLRLNGEITFLKNRRDQLEDRLNSTSRHAISGNVGVALVEDPSVRLARAKLDLKSAREQYTENHPDVRRLRELIVELDREVRSQQRTDAALSAPTNPAYLRLLDQLNEVEARLSAAMSSQAQVQEVVKDLTNKSMRDPAVEQRYNALVRDLDRAQKEFADVEERSHAAQLAQSMENEQRGERFILLLGASHPRLPESPNRIGIILLSGLFGAFAGAARVIISEARDNVVRSAKDVKTVFGADPIGVIPVIQQSRA